MKVLVELERSELFILDHALRGYIKRDGAKERDVKKENALLDYINDGIRATRAKLREVDYVGLHREC